MSPPPPRPLRHIPSASTPVRGAGSSPGFESECEACRKLGFPDRPLCALDVVPHAPELERLLVRVPDAIARGWASVPWLTDAAGVHQGRPLEAERVDAVFVSDRAFGCPKYSRHVRMTVKTQTTVQQLEVRVRHGSVENVLIDVIARTCVYEENILLDMAVRQTAKPLKTVLT